MPSDIEISDCDSSVAASELHLDPAIAATVSAGPERVIYKLKEYVRRPGVRATREPSVIWSVGKEYKRNKKRFWRCSICKKTTMLVMQNGISSALRHLKKDHKIDKQGRRIQTKQRTIIETI